LTCLTLVGAATSYLFANHFSHVIEYLPLDLIRACPLMHVFRHGLQGHHHDSGSTINSAREP
jgi:hypothetical protein